MKSSNETQLELPASCVKDDVVSIPVLKPVPVPQKDQNLALEQEWTYRLHDKLLKMVDLSLIGKMDKGLARMEIREIVQRLMNNESVPLPAVSRKRVIQQVEAEVLGLGPLEPLIMDPTISDILVNGCNAVFIERKGKLEKTRIRFRDDRHLLQIIDRIVVNIGRRIDESSPMVDARLPDGSRINAIIPPLALDGPMLSIRRFSIEHFSMKQLIELGCLTPAAAEILRAVVRGKMNIIISGGTGSGKTTMLNVLSGMIPADERIVTIEDSAELQLQRPHVVRLEIRPPNSEGQGEVTQRDLVCNSLRMRPDRIIIGEVRGGESLDMLQAMNTGHEGSLTTIHANSPRDALMRLETMIMMAKLALPLQVVRSQIATAINVVIQVERMEDGKRRLVSIQEIQGLEGEVITMLELFKFKRQGIDQDGNVMGELSPTGLVPKCLGDLLRRGCEIDVSLFQQNADAI